MESEERDRREIREEDGSDGKTDGLGEDFEDERGGEFGEERESAGGSRKKKFLKRAAAVGISVSVAAACFFAGWFGYRYSLDEELRDFLWAYGIAENHYYRPLEETDFYEDLYAALELDPYSGYYSPQGYSEYRDRSEGQNAGVGLSLTDETKDGVTLPRVFLVYENSPASRAGVRKGMYIFGFGESEETLQTGDSDALVQFVGSKEGELVLRCGYSRDGSDAMPCKMTRGQYRSAFAFYQDSEAALRFRYEGTGKGEGELVELDEPLSLLDAKTAYIRLDEFGGGNAADEFFRCLKAMKERGRTDLILDLRTNGGGYLDTFTEIASHLLRNSEKGSSCVVAQAVYRDGRKKKYRSGNCSFDCFSENSRVMILADENTASASECLIGALVDYGTVKPQDIFLRENEKGIAKTYGKGIMQSHYTTLSGAAMKLTVAEIVWPSGKSIHGVGVTPEDGATPVKADLIWGGSDPMLEAAVNRLAEESAS